MQKYFILSFLVFSSCVNPSKRIINSIENPDCGKQCIQNQVCVNTFTDKGSRCESIPSYAPINFVLPFDSSTEVVCTHSSGSGSHSGFNAYFALDLASEYSGTAATVTAAADGIAYVFLGEDGDLCPEPKGKPELSEPSNCGDSWGNRVKILHPNGYFSFYVHLASVLVKTGDKIKQGDAIGVEGSTGAAGHRHLHWSVQKLPGNPSQWSEQILTYTGDSVPFTFKAIQNSKLQIFDSLKISCAHAGIGQAPASQQPRFKGVVN